MAIWYNVWPFGVVCGPLVYFSVLVGLGPRKIWQPCSEAESQLFRRLFRQKYFQDVNIDPKSQSVLPRPL
jgi:hypothetical protein